MGPSKSRGTWRAKNVCSGSTLVFFKEKTTAGKAWDTLGRQDDLRDWSSIIGQTAVS